MCCVTNPSSLSMRIDRPRHAVPPFLRKLLHE
jgi:hypothetical protein